MKHNVHPPPGHCQWSLTAMARPSLPLLQAAGRGSRAGALMGRERKTTRCTGGLKLEQLAGLSLNLPARRNQPAIDPSSSISPAPPPPHLPFSRVSCLKLKAPSDPIVLCFGFVIFNFWIFESEHHQLSYYPLPSSQVSCLEFKAPSDFDVM